MPSPTKTVAPTLECSSQPTQPQSVGERVAAYGPRNLSDLDLLAAVADLDATAAPPLLGRGATLGDLALLDRDQLRAIPLGDGPLIRLLLTLELARRLAFAEFTRNERELLCHPDAVAAYLTLMYARCDQEVLGAIFLDSRNRRIADRELFRGAHNRAAVEPRAIFRCALELGAAGVIVFHNHPGGDPTPSAEDRAFTERIAGAGTIMGIKLVDHLILGRLGSWRSLLDPWAGRAQRAPRSRQPRRAAGAAS